MRAKAREAGVSLIWADDIIGRIYFTGSAQQGVVMVPMTGEPVFFVRKSVSRAEQESRIPVEPHPGRKSLLRRIKEELGPKGRLGLDLDVLPGSTYRLLAESLGPDLLVDLGAALRQLRARKSSWELDQIRLAGKQVPQVMEQAGLLIRPDVTEMEVSASLEKTLRLFGHPGVVRLRTPGSDAPSVTVVSGQTAVTPTAFDGPDGGEGPFPCSPPGAGNKPLAMGESVLVDVLTCANGYYADHSRTFFLGRTVPPRVADAHRFCTDVLEWFQSNCKSGLTCSEIVTQFQQTLVHHPAPEGFMGYGENHVRFFGHGVGLVLDDLPVLASGIDMVLEPGMVLAVEPKVVLEGIGAVGVEDTLVINEQGAAPLCSIGRDIRTIET